MKPLIATLCSSACSLVLFAAEEARPNFIFFLSDDISQEDHGCYGHPVIKTPRIDALAANGMRFDNAYLAISSCSPSRCSIITGRYEKTLRSHLSMRVKLRLKSLKTKGRVPPPGEPREWKTND